MIGSSKNSVATPAGFTLLAKGGSPMALTLEFLGHDSDDMI